MPPRSSPDRADSADQPEIGVAAARGTGTDLLLLLWRRNHGPIDVHGDHAVLDRLLARTNLD